MKHSIFSFKILIFLGVLLSTTSCEDFMSTDTDRYLKADDNLLNSPNDTVYSVIGILSKVQKLSDKYVLLGELRGDLLDISTQTESEFSDISNFTIDPSKNKFSDVKDYYAVINNCNYFIQRADTNIMDKVNKPFVKEVAAVKTIRAWTYMQLVLNYGKAYYSEKPILTVTDAVKNYPEFNQEQMVDTLITQLTALNPIVNTALPGFVSGSSKSIFINTLFLLGDLHLWRASFNHSIVDYESAALYYSKLIKQIQIMNLNITLPTFFWKDSQFTKSMTDNWSSIFTSSDNPDRISCVILASTSSEGTTTQLPSLAIDRKVVASTPLLDLFSSQVYCYKDPTASYPTFTTGDLRGKGSFGLMINKETLLEEKFIVKYLTNNVNIYRVGLLYLRYAEAVNRAGKPGVAFAVLKYGLNKENLVKPTYVPQGELRDNKDYVSIFKDEVFSNTVDNKTVERTIGLHSRGCGNSILNTFYRIPDKNQLAAVGMDSITFVENTICDELALETAFEGNRFQDLMRLSNHRNDPLFLAEKVARKHANNPGIKTLLSDKKNWLVPVRSY